MKKYKAEKKEIRVTGRASLGWFLGRGYVSECLSVKTQRWIVSDNANRTIAICKSKIVAENIATLLNGMIQE